VVSPHRDAHDASYLQILGQSFWKLGEETIILNPGDIVFLSKEITHEVWGEGPRMGVLLMALKPL
jgi:quercetin dioxygenase-like cupin family protein